MGCSPPIISISASLDDTSHIRLLHIMWYFCIGLVCNRHLIFSPRWFAAKGNMNVMN
ncbi:hypothetical protein Plhal304r1_c002g0006201 [Plasmopara halstedii]